MLETNVTRTVAPWQQICRRIYTRVETLHNDRNNIMSSSTPKLLEAINNGTVYPEVTIHMVQEPELGSLARVKVKYPWL